MLSYALAVCSEVGSGRPAGHQFLIGDQAGRVGSGQGSGGLDRAGSRKMDLWTTLGRPLIVTYQSRAFSMCL
jgi:hypothetical protein